MSIQIYVFASLSDRLGISQTQLDATVVQTVMDAWKLLSNDPLDNAILVAINQQYAQFDDPIVDGDEVAFFPPVTGG